MRVRHKQNGQVQGQLEPRVEEPLASFASLFPCLTWQLEAFSWGDGKGDREPGALSLFHQDGLTKCALRDRNVGQVAFLAAPTVSQVLSLLEARLRDHKLVLRPDKYARPS